MSTARGSLARAGAARRKERDSFTRRAVIASAVLAASALAVLMVLQVVHVLLMTFAGVLFAVFLWRLARELAERTPLQIGASLIVVVLGLFVLLYVEDYLGQDVDRASESM